uniref:HAD family hydrolase n=1 Tax=Xenorhabdus sp. TH1 TaxID=3130166 RepID=UPI0040403C69
MIYYFESLFSWPSRIEYIFKLHQLHQYFEQVICRDDVEHGKPNPEGFILCARRLGVAPSDCLIFEDSISGILAANRSGAKCIGIGMSEIPEGESITVYAVYEDYTKMPAMFK